MKILYPSLNINNFQQDQFEQLFNIINHQLNEKINHQFNEEINNSPINNIINIKDESISISLNKLFIKHLAPLGGRKEQLPPLPLLNVLKKLSKRQGETFLTLVTLGFNFEQAADLTLRYFLWESTQEDSNRTLVSDFLLAQLTKRCEPEVLFRELIQSRALINSWDLKSSQRWEELLDKMLCHQAPKDKKTTPLSTTMGIEFEFFGLDNTAVVDHIIDKIIKMNRHEDRSIRPDDGSSGLEYTTPVLSAFDELDRVLLVLDVLKAADARTNASCGLHFHLGITNFSAIPPQVEKEHYQLELTKNFLILYYRFAEPNFREVLRPYNRYCENQENLKSSAQGDCGFYAAIRQCRTLNELINLACPVSRFYAVNLRSLSKYGTIEIRRHDGSIDREIVESMAKTLNNIMLAAINETNRMLCPQQPSRVPELASATTPFVEAKKQIAEQLGASHQVAYAGYAHSRFFLNKKAMPSTEQALPPIRLNDLLHLI